MADYGKYETTFRCRNANCISQVYKEDSICRTCSLGKQIREVLENTNEFTDYELGSTFFTIMDRI